MGSELCFNLVPYDPDPLVALQRLQENLVSDLDFPALVQQNLAYAQEDYDSVRNDDPSQILDGHYVVDALAHAKQMANRPLPTTPAEKVAFIRDLYRYSEEISVLDIRGVTREPEYDLFNAYLCDDPSGLVGVERIPTDDAQDYADELSFDLGRGQSMMVPAYDDPDVDQPTHWLIVSMTVD